VIEMQKNYMIEAHQKQLKIAEKIHNENIINKKRAD
jgi:hypothetical protein